MMVLHRGTRSVQHSHFYDLPDYLLAGDVLVFNDTRVIPARLRAQKETGAKLEVLLLQRLRPNTWQVLVKPAKRVFPGTKLVFLPQGGSPGNPVIAEVSDAGDGGIRVLTFEDDSPLGNMGTVPLPPYIHTPLSDPERYQTVYARLEGSAAAPTAGLHFTPALIEG